MPARLPRARTLKGDPKLVHYDSGGGAAGEPPLVLVHGATGRSHDWENIFPRLATRYRVIAYDARGHGKSGRATDYGVGVLAADLVRVLREIAKAPAIVIGHSIGGATALVAASRSPELVRALVLEDPWLARYRDGWRASYYSALRRALDARDDRVALRRALERVPLPETGPRGERTLGEVRGFYSLDRVITYYETIDPGFVETLSIPDPAGAALIAEAKSGVRCPILLLASDPRMTALAEGEADQLASNSDTTVLRFPGVGHLIHGVRPEKFLEALEPFLRKARSS